MHEAHGPACFADVNSLAGCMSSQSQQSVNTFAMARSRGCTCARQDSQSRIDQVVSLPAALCSRSASLHGWHGISACGLTLLHFWGRAVGDVHAGGDISDGVQCGAVRGDNPGTGGTGGAGAVAGAGKGDGAVAAGGRHIPGSCPAQRLWCFFSPAHPCIMPILVHLGRTVACRLRDEQGRWCRQDC